MIHIRAQALASILWPALCKARFFKDISIDDTFTTSVREAAEKYKFDHPSPSWLHRVLLSLLVQAQPSTSLTCTPSGTCKPESLAMFLPFPGDVFYIDAGDMISTYNLLFLQRTSLVILNAMSLNSNSNHYILFSRILTKGESSTRILRSF